MTIFRKSDFWGIVNFADSMISIEIVDFILQLELGCPNSLKLIMRIVINNKGRPLNCQGCQEYPGLFNSYNNHQKWLKFANLKGG